MEEKGKDGQADAEEQALKKRVFRGVCFSWLTAVIAHTMNLQSEAIMVRDACGGDLGRAARLMSQSSALAGFTGLIVNQFGGKLSDSFGRKQFYLIGPIAQVAAGLLAFLNPRNALALAASKVVRAVFTTFSGTVMCMAGLRDAFKEKELAVVSSQAGAAIGLGVMIGPILEGFMLRFAGRGSEKYSYLALVVFGVVSFLGSWFGMPETHPKEKWTEFKSDQALLAANPFSFVKIFTEGSLGLKKLASIVTLQTMVDGKNISDITQLWTREHLKLSIEGIRNFIVGYGIACTLAGAKLTPALLKNMSVSGFTTLTNMLNLIAFSFRGSKEKAMVFFGVLPLMLPGVNGSSATALNSVVNAHLKSCGFGVGESSAWMNNMRVVAGVAATLLYGYFYSWARKVGINPGHTFLVAGLIGAGLPQALFSLIVTSDELKGHSDPKKEALAKKEASSA